MEKNIRGRDIFARYKSGLITLSKFYGLFSLKRRKKMLEKHRYMRGYLGYGVRYALLKSIAKSCGDNVLIAPGVYLNNAQNLIIGTNVSIHPMCYIECGGSDDNYIQIDNNVSIAHGCTIIATSHTYQSDLTDIIRDMEVIASPIHICENVWLGAKATVLFGTTINSGCVVGANSLVNKNTDPDGIYVGSPARRIKNRKE